MELHLGGRTAFVTGATSGIGRGIALALAAERVNLIIAGRRREGLEDTARAVEAIGAPAPAIVLGDIATDAGVKVIAATALAAANGCIDILVNNAGASRPLADMTDDAGWLEAMMLNFTAARRLTDALLAPMKAAKWGRIINLSGALVAPGPNASGAAKSALNSWSRTLAIDLAPHGVTVNAIAPGRIESEQIRSTLHPTEASRAAYIAKFIPMGRFGEPADIAALVTFLASPLAGYISGAAIPVDGAMLRIS